MSKNGELDIDKFRITDAAPPPAAPTGPTIPRRARQPKGKLFTMVPETWRDRLADAKHAATFKLALHLLHQHWKQKGAWLTLANTTIKGVTRDTKRAALEELETLGLITVERRSNRSPRVRVREF
jgi:hypothetical protein